MESYSAYVGSGLLLRLPLHIRQLAPASMYVMITDSNVFPLYGSQLVDAFTAQGLTLHHLVLPPGETSKTRQTKARVEDFLLSLQCGRDSCLLALGGGVIGDLTGFVAATYMRGIPYLQLPSSLLAMVDSSIGGKTGIDAPKGKNLIGAFHRPRAVIIDTSLLSSLPVRELGNGMAEVVKAGAIADDSLFSLCESAADKVMTARDTAVLTELIYRAVQFKARVVTADEREGGLRSILNFGHSIGHAVEAIMLPSLLHGECVSIGMMEEALLSRSLGFLSSAAIRRLDNCVTAYRLPTRLPRDCSAADIVQRMGVDKKNMGGKKQIVMLTAIGSVRADPYTTAVTDAQLLALLSPSITLVPSSSSPSGRVSVPGSKSLSNRILLLSAMGRGPCRVRGLLHSQDTQVMLDSLRELGVKFHFEDGQQTLVVQGSGGQLSLPSRELYLGNAGTASRFLATLVTVVKGGADISLTGNARMRERPIADLVDALRANGCRITYQGKEGCLPIRVRSDGFPGGLITLKANISSQFVSSILLSAPHALQPVTLRLDTSAAAVVSKPFIDMTVALMAKFGIRVTETAAFTYQVQRGVYSNPAELQVEGDASSATYPLALAAVSEGGEVTVDNVGSDSLQGDSKFCQLLAAMGCTVRQEAMRTTVRGPARLDSLRAVDADMDAMTDTFMTLAAVAAFARGTTRITNIANQRVKECNRLQVMCEELRKCGVTARETDTGMEIEGKAGAWQLPSATTDSGQTPEVIVDCHDDHRIAMSFSIIAAKVQGVVIDDKRCVDKTYPEYWEHLQQHLHCSTAVPASALPEASSSSSSSAAAAAAPSPSVLIIIGMRGAGKTTIGQQTAVALSFAFVDIDAVIEQQVGNIRQYVDTQGWPAFRKLEAATFHSTLAASPSSTVISCGGGIVEDESVRAVLRSGQQGVVVWLHRDIADIAEYLRHDSVRPGFDPLAVYATRKDWYLQCSQYEHGILAGDYDWHRTQQSFIRLAQHVLGLRRLTLAPHSFFLSLTFPDLTPALPYMEEMTEGVDAVELRVDLLEHAEPDFIRRQLAMLRQHTSLPVIWTVRSEREGGGWSGDEHRTMEMLLLGLRLGCEYLDVEVKGGAGLQGRRRVCDRRRHTLLIGSHHTPDSNGGSDDDLVAALQACDLNGQADVLKLVVSAATADDAVRLMHIVAGEKISKPVIALAMGDRGKLSRACNTVLTPVTHPLLPNAAAPGQMTVRELMQVRQTLCLVMPKQFCLFGSPITHSPSPLLHNTAFRLCALPYGYSKVETIEIDRVAEVMKGASFGGGSVTIPLKEQVGVLCQTLSAAAQAIGAVNTIVKQPDGSLHGDNTDWLGIHRLLHPLLPTLCPQDSAAVIGAGGTARAALYALIHLGFSGTRLLIHNPRTPAHATALAREFTGTAVTSLSPATISHTTLRVLICTLPSSVGWTVDAGVIKSGLLVFDTSYLPPETPLMAQAVKANAVVVKGLDMLLEQGLAQFEAWTGRSRDVVRAEVERSVRDAYKTQWGGK